MPTHNQLTELEPVNSLEQFKHNMATLCGFNPENKEQGKCINCSEPFSEKNTHTDLGWKETKISGLCEDCFDKITVNF